MADALPYREAVPACIHAETYKYYFQRERVTPLWQALERRYGAVRMNGAFRMMEIEGEHFWLRSVIGGNPITVLRRRGCPEAAIAELHEIFGFEGRRE